MKIFSKDNFVINKGLSNPFEFRNFYSKSGLIFRPEPYTLLDPFTGRNKDISGLKTKKKQPKKNFIFGLPFDLFQDKSSRQPITRTQRRIPSNIESRNPYLASNGTPIYKYRQKNPLGQIFKNNLFLSFNL